VDNPTDEIQVSPGELKASPEGEVQPPVEENVCRFRTTSETYDDLDPREVLPVTGVPDYLDPTASLHPLVVESEGIYHCIDGWEMILKAIEEGKDRIRCDVSHVPGCSETELSIRKAAVRTMPKGGVARYPELIRNAIILSKMLLSSKEDLVVYSHGGDRRGEGFKKNRENSIRLVLAERLGKSEKTVSSYLSYGEYLTNGALETLIQAGATKEFFEEAQRVKRRMLADLKSSNASEEEICVQISQAMIRMNENHEEIKNLKTTLMGDAEESGEEEEDASPAPQTLKRKDREVTLDHWNGDQNWSEAPYSEEEIRRDGASIALRIKGSFEDKGLALPALKEAVARDIQDLLAVIRRMDGLEASERRDD
jgi:hypothetical protein